MMHNERPKYLLPLVAGAVIAAAGIYAMLRGKGDSSEEERDDRCDGCKELNRRTASGYPVVGFDGGGTLRECPRCKSFVYVREYDSSSTNDAETIRFVRHDEAKAKWPSAMKGR